VRRGNRDARHKVLYGAIPTEPTTRLILTFSTLKGGEGTRSELFLLILRVGLDDPAARSHMTPVVYARCGYLVKSEAVSKNKFCETNPI
jgi:hypothetical protein